MNTNALSLVMPSPFDGRVTLLPSMFELSTSTTEQDFLASADGRSSAVWVANPPHVSYRLRGEYGLDEQEFWVVVWFSSSRLAAVELSLKADAETEANWNNWDPALEQSAHRLQTELLLRRYGVHPVDCPWGTIRSDYDPRGGGTAITIRFDQRPQ